MLEALTILVTIVFFAGCVLAFKSIGQRDAHVHPNPDVESNRLAGTLALLLGPAGLVALIAILVVLSRLAQ